MKDGKHITYFENVHYLISIICFDSYLKKYKLKINNIINFNNRLPYLFPIPNNNLILNNINNKLINNLDYDNIIHITPYQKISVWLNSSHNSSSEEINFRLNLKLMQLKLFYDLSVKYRYSINKLIFININGCIDGEDIILNVFKISKKQYCKEVEIISSIHNLIKTMITLT